jgi:hypothetical protein
MPLVSSPYANGGIAKKVNFGDKLRRFIVGPSDDDIIKRVQDYSSFATYSNDIWGGASGMQTMGLLREVPSMLRDPVIDSALNFLMETAFQKNDKNEVMWVVSPYDIIKKELQDFHSSVGMQKLLVTVGYNLLLWGNLPFKHFFNDGGELVNFTVIPDFTKVVPLVISGKTLGYMVDGEFCYPFEYSFSQLEYNKNLGGVFKTNYMQLNGMAGNSEGAFGVEFQNEFVPAPSYLSSAVRPWKNINIIEDALMLNRMDQSNYYRIISVLVGGSVHSKSAIRTLNYYRNLMKKVRKVSYDASGMASRGGGQEYEVVVPKTSNQGVEITDVGGNIDVKAIKDLENQYSKLFAALGVQPSQIGFGEEQTNAVGDSNGRSYDRRFARKCRMLVSSVQEWLWSLDQLYLRSRGYDVNDGDWKYGTVSLSVLEDQERAETLGKAVENLKSIGDVLSSVGLDSYNKNYLVESLLGQPLSATGIDVQELLKVSENEGDEEKDISLISDYRRVYLTSMFDTMEYTGVVGKEFVRSARESLLGDEDVPRLIASSGGVSSVPIGALDSGECYLWPDSTVVDVRGECLHMKGTTEGITSDLQKAGKDVQELVSVDFGSTVLIPEDLQITLKDINSSGIRALGRGFLNSRGELILVDRSDVAAYLYMKKSGLFTCLVSRLVSVP